MRTSLRLENRAADDDGLGACTRISSTISPEKRSRVMTLNGCLHRGQIARTFDHSRIQEKQKVCEQESMRAIISLCLLFRQTAHFSGVGGRTETSASRDSCGNLVSFFGDVEGEDDEESAIVDSGSVFI